MTTKLIEPCLIKPGTVGLASQYAPHGTEFAFQCYEGTDFAEAVVRAERIVRPNPGLVAMRGHFAPTIGGSDWSVDWHYLKAGFMFFRKLS